MEPINDTDTAAAILAGAQGQSIERRTGAYTAELPPEVAAKVAEADRLRKLFDDAGQGEYDVLALIDHYQRNSMDADERLRAVRRLLGPLPAGWTWADEGRGG